MGEPVASAYPSPAALGAAEEDNHFKHDGLLRHKLPVTALGLATLGIGLVVALNSGGLCS
ncbi:hypothetical protein [Streptoalloteichus tenebrarius]|uniref:hypothetical protein n=1 Tax=Streptoalloteichus tenebrarius (strain ATCC 17920 / DSM 40477 / JCM 4838 / CBS 697.72 / NBRC 16177 / NCIMB 11028 / NRRL B-12390 / A12253. 1 / ISP 5477) TaxID=1933 RepID=UPI0035E84D6F|nr:hypothetical protein GCM10020241_11800 [Streptoalloteichus tenebrarius]